MQKEDVVDDHDGDRLTDAAGEAAEDVTDESCSYVLACDAAIMLGNPLALILSRGSVIDTYKTR